MDCETPAVEALYTCRMTEGWRVIIIPISCVVWHKHTVLLEQINSLLNCIKQSGCIIHGYVSLYLHFLCVYMTGIYHLSIAVS